MNELHLEVQNHKDIMFETIDAEVSILRNKWAIV